MNGKSKLESVFEFSKAEEAEDDYDHLETPLTSWRCPEVKVFEKCL